MPQFYPEYVPTDCVDDIARGFFEAAEFAAFDDKELTRGDTTSLAWSREAVAYVNDAARRIAADAELQALLEAHRAETETDETGNGRDFYFTSARHGVGFWNRDDPHQGRVEALGNAADAYFPHVDCYRYRSKLYISGTERFGWSQARCDREDARRAARDAAREARK